MKIKRSIVGMEIGMGKCITCGREVEKLFCKEMCVPCYSSFLKTQNPAEHKERQEIKNRKRRENRKIIREEKQKNTTKPILFCKNCGLNFEKLRGYGLCDKCYLKDYYEKNQEKISLKQKEKKRIKREEKQKIRQEEIQRTKEEKRIERNRKARERGKKERLENPEIVKERKRKWAKRNPNSVKSTAKKTYEKNKQKILRNSKKRHKERLNTEPLFKLKKNIKNLIERSLNVMNYTKKSYTYELLGCTYEEFLNYIGPKPEGNYHLDHICPCAQAKNEEELIKLQHYTNFQWLTAKENLMKSDCKTLKGEELCKSLLGREWIDKKTLDKL